MLEQASSWIGFKLFSGLFSFFLFIPMALIWWVGFFNFCFIQECIQRLLNGPQNALVCCGTTSYLPGVFASLEGAKR